MERRWIDYLVTAIAAAVAAYAKETLFRSPGREMLSYGVSILAGLLAFQLLNLLRYLLDRVFRLDPRFDYLGFWIEEALGEASKYCMLFEVKHDPLVNRFSVEGNTFHAETSLHYADFFSVAVSFPESNRMDYLHKAKILGRNGEITGLTRLNFIGAQGPPFEGTGSFINNSDPLESADFCFERLRSADIRRLIGKTRLSSANDRQKLVQAQEFAEKPRPPPSDGPQILRFTRFCGLNDRWGSQARLGLTRFWASASCDGKLRAFFTKLLTPIPSGVPPERSGRHLRDRPRSESVRWDGFEVIWLGWEQ